MKIWVEQKSSVLADPRPFNPLYHLVFFPFTLQCLRDTWLMSRIAPAFVTLAYLPPRVCLIQLDSHFNIYLFWIWDNLWFLVLKSPLFLTCPGPFLAFASIPIYANLLFSGTFAVFSHDVSQLESLSVLCFNLLMVRVRSLQELKLISCRHLLLPPEDCLRP